MCSLNNI